MVRYLTDRGLVHSGFAAFQVQLNLNVLFT
jgi:hypothetical protein